VSPRLRRGLIIIGLVLSPFVVCLLFTYQIIRVRFPTDMADQLSVGYQEGPRLLPPEGAVPLQGQAVIPEEFPANPVAADRDLAAARDDPLQHPLPAVPWPTGAW